MICSLKTDRYDERGSIFFVYINAIMAILLNQSRVIFGANISFADFFLVFILFLLGFKYKMVLPLAPTLFFLFLSIILLLTSLYYVPIKLFYNPDSSKIFIDYMKLMMAFLYFIVGYNIAYLNLTEAIIKWYSNCALLIGLIGIFFTTFNIQVFRQILFYGGLRFRGFMNDPNYFSVIQISALVYFSRANNIKFIYKVVVLLLVIMSVLISGSKTGLITLLCYLVLRILEHLFTIKKKLKSSIFDLVLVIILLFAIVSASSYIHSLIKHITNIIPSFGRIQYVFSDINAAISGGGSSRNHAWMLAIEVIKLSPIIGIGIGTYSDVSEKFLGSRVLAHNTYLQLLAEWGLLLASAFFLYIFFLVIKVIYFKKNNKGIILVLKDMIIVFLIGSLAISLNNARMFWLLLGLMMCNTYRSTDRLNIEIE